MVSYKLVTYRAAKAARSGVVVEEELFDVAELTGRSSYATMLDILNDWESAQALLDTAATKIREGKIKGIPLGEVKLLAPVLYPSAIFCAGANYVDHMQEMAVIRKIDPGESLRDMGLKPWHFLKTSRTVVETESIVRLPESSKMVDWEAELAVVIGQPARKVPVEKALAYVAGYTIANDLSARDLAVRPEISPTSPFRYDWMSQKNFDRACPLGPWIVPAKEIADPQNLSIRLWVNEILKQDSHTSKMIFSVAEQIAHLSTLITLHPGDLILSGTPSGVGSARKEFLKSGDLVRVWIEGIGTLSNTLE
jgi:2-keto-4-pentenoate hydratase/2-oxohepta-3-ene-1,7-dioic acid hydratase in catechol pathway